MITPKNSAIQAATRDVKSRADYGPPRAKIPIQDNTRDLWNSTVQDKTSDLHSHENTTNIHSPRKRQSPPQSKTTDFDSPRSY